MFFLWSLKRNRQRTDVDKIPNELARFFNNKKWKFFSLAKGGGEKERGQGGRRISRFYSLWLSLTLYSVFHYAKCVFNTWLPFVRFQLPASFNSCIYVSFSFSLSSLTGPTPAWETNWTSRTSRTSRTPRGQPTPTQFMGVAPMGTKRSEQRQRFINK